MNRKTAFALGAVAILAAAPLLTLLDDSDAVAQVRPLALEGTMVMTVEGRQVVLTDADKAEIAQRIPAVADALPSADQASVRWSAALTADQRTIVGDDPPEQWTPRALLTRWRGSSGSAITQGAAAAELEIALIAQQFLAR